MEKKLTTLESFLVSLVDSINAFAANMSKPIQFQV